MKKLIVILCFAEPTLPCGHAVVYRYCYVCVCVCVSIGELLNLPCIETSVY